MTTSLAIALMNGTALATRSVAAPEPGPRFPAPSHYLDSEGVLHVVAPRFVCVNRLIWGAERKGQP